VGISGRGGAVVGREPELGVLRELVTADSPVRALVLFGEPGIGKSTLWETGLEIAREHGLHILRARPSDAEAQLSFAALTDLLDGVDPVAVADIPAPQRRALEVALLRTEPEGTPPGERAIALGFLSVLRGLADRAPLLVAIDDVQWLDPASAAALAFAARRLGDRPVRFLLARRRGPLSPLERELAPTGSERLEVGGISMGATRRMLAEQLGLVVSRRVLRRIFGAADGNPLFALELGRALADGRPLEIGGELALPDSLDELLGARVAEVAERVRSVALAVALSGGSTIRELTQFADPADLDAAVDAGLLAVDGELVRSSHPLVAAAVRARSSPQERQRLHLALAHATTNRELEARHLALAAERPDAALAASIHAAAVEANARGAVEDAVELAGHALRLARPESEERAEYVLALGEYLYRAGELSRLNALLLGELETLPAGAARARAHLLLSIAPPSIAESVAHLEQAFAESAEHPLLRAKVLTERSEELTMFRLERLPLAEQWALEALRLAGASADEEIASSLGWVLILRGRPIDDLVERSATTGTTRGAGSLERLSGIRLAFRGETARARSTFARLLEDAALRGEEWDVDGHLLQLCELELRAGDYRAASSRLSEIDHSSHVTAVGTSAHESRLRAVLAAVGGFPDEAERFAAAAIAATETTEGRWDLLESLRARGVAALCAGDPARAAESLRLVWEHTRREGIDDPGAFPVAPDLVEALVELGDLEEAERITARLQEQAEEQEHPWGLATSKRCRGLIRLGTGADPGEGAAAMLDAADQYEALGLRFDGSRTLLALGRVQRRLRKWGAARSALERAATAFDEIGAEGWAERARSELARVGGRRPQAEGELTPTERRTAELAAQGLSNKQIAGTLFVSVHTVEVHLSRTYAKLGIRSRAQLARQLAQNG
jgi:DNA-binding CsgD family transcriptional regulator